MYAIITADGKKFICRASPHKDGYFTADESKAVKFITEVGANEFREFVENKVDEPLIVQPNM